MGPPTKLYIDGRPETSPGKISEILNGSFIKKIMDIRESFGPNPARLDPLISYRHLVSGKNLENTFSITTVDRRALRKVVKGMSPTRSTGIDGVSMKIIKEYFPYVEAAILNLVNRSIILKIFPSNLKTSKIVQILKPGKIPGEAGSYRPSNLLPGI